MKKISISIVLILAAIWTGMTSFMSNKTEAVFDEILTKSNDALVKQLPFAHVKKQAYEQGFISSTAKSVITLDGGQFGSKSDPVDVPFQHTLYHGPIMLTPNGVKIGTSYVYTTLDESLLSAEKDRIKLLFNNEEPIILGMQSGFGGAINSEITIAPVSFDGTQYDKIMNKVSDAPNTVSFTFAGMTGHFASDTTGSYLNGALNIGAIELKDDKPGKNVLVTNAASVITIAGNELYKGVMLDGAITLTMPEFLLSNHDESSVSLRGLNVVSKMAEENGSFNGSASFDVDKLLIKNPNAPVTLPESKLQLTSSVKGFSREDVLKLIDVGQTIQATQVAASGNNDPAKAQAALVASIKAYYAAFGQMIKQGTGIHINFEISNDKGQSTIDFNLDYVDANKMFELKIVKDLILALQGQLKISIDKKMIAGMPIEQMINGPVQMGFAVDKGENYEAIAELAAGELVVNGNPMSLLARLGEAANQPIPWK